MDLVPDEPPPTGADVVEELKAAGDLDRLFARIDAGEIELTGSGGLIPGLIKAALERGLQAELGILGEEDGASEGSSGITWVMTRVIRARRCFPTHATARRLRRWPPRSGTCP